MKIIKNKFVLSLFFITLMLMGVVIFGAKNVSALEDTYEDNDDFGSAWSVGPGFYPDLYQGDDDWFNISVAADDVLKVSLEFDGDQNDIDLELYNSSEIVIDESYGMDDNETVAYISLVAQILYIRIFGENNEETYNMTIEILVKGTYDDIYDENEGNDDFPQAPEILPNYFNNLVNNDTDIYKIQLDHNKEASFDIYNTSNLWAQLYSYEYNWLADFNVVDSHLELDWIPESSEYYYIRVNGPNLGDFYDLDIWIAEDDWAEENNIQDDSEELDIGFYSGLIQYDDDWFSYNYLISATQIVGIDLYYDTAFVLDVALIDEFGSPHGYTIIPEAWGERLEWTAAVDYSNISIYVHGSDIGLEYNMSLYIYGGSDDWAEPNDYLSEARYLNLVWNGGMVQNNDDWFEVWLEPNDKLDLNLFYNTWETWMNLELYDEYEGLLTNSSMNGDHLHLNWTNDDYGRNRYIKISGPNNGDFYDLELIFNGQTGDDWAEENDYWDSTKYLNTGSHKDLINLDDDYFSFHLKEGDTGKINIYCESYAPIWLEEINSKDGSILKTDYSTEDGFLELEIYVDYEYDVIFAVKGNNVGEWYNLELKIDYKNDNGDDGDDGDNSGDDKNDKDPFADFDFSSIPGFPLEFVGTVFIISTISIIFFVKKRKH